MKNANLIYTLYAQGSITKERFEELQQSMQNTIQNSLYRLFLGLGYTLVTVGILFFLASNWATIPSSVKLIGIQSILIAVIYLAYRYKNRKFLFATFTIIASVLVGINLAVFGQVYQTGADAYTLFATWTLLISLWAWFLKLPALFMMWQALLYLSLLLFFNQYLFVFTDITQKQSEYFLIFLANTLLFISLRKKELTIFAHKTNQIVMLMIALIITSIPVYELITYRSVNFNSIFFFLFVVQTALLCFYYHRQKALLPVGLILLDILIFIEFTLARVMIDLSSDAFLLFGIITIALTVGLVKLLKKLNLSYKGVRV
jgi:uncharacterized membrane protein